MKSSFLISSAIAIVLAALAAASAAGRPDGHSSFSLARAKNYVTGSGPVSVAVGDVDGDRLPDLATADEGADSISVFLNKGNGRLGARRTFATGQHPTAVALGDLNGDGKADVATTSNVYGSTGFSASSTLSVLLSRGDGTFIRSADYATAADPKSLAIGDLNGDGRADVAVAGAQAHAVSVFLNRGDGSLGPRRDYVVGYAQSVGIGDLNGDGKPDLAVASCWIPAPVTVLFNDGHGSFDTKHNVRTRLCMTSVAVGDLNRDGKADLALTDTADDLVAVLLNKGGGAFGAHVDYRTGFMPRTVAIGDLTGDGKPDLATANAGDLATRSPSWFGVSVLVSKGGGTFRQRLDYQTSMDTTADSFPQAIAISDLNGDGKPDLAATSVSYRARFNTLSVFLNRPGFCNVQNVVWMRVPVAKRVLARANCHLGIIRHGRTRYPSGRVFSQVPRPGRVLARGARVDVLVSLGPRR